ncbi:MULTISPECIES: arabinosyltransferase domain-containing protein [unclassified Saccharopolyspora]|uniref:arabinosyltransferase domain-containing protein n=1 Tax=unclassified Saccharopolyspora TaxID=2646250 RepID=UPI001CD71138|nr:MULTISPECIES: arabinosyltransferase domain-containing protein [unclassified Saccharopolyspora]MCA1185014.1 arabinosyltransferase domain-containing protein [Saccharopolyspora sp. 6T]MCA1190736.1 arabinosyltransferase domain-containing protein [Saccharopolyspora sp. 6V]MCA1226233.1 arabinosyltransferase domain-containing protein [Saccharopolyspora sp. 6M]MCA1278200.1 arabinosyltransferase domain-containing protein [Saccharopolyspora sp. 7B]
MTATGEERRVPALTKIALLVGGLGVLAALALPFAPVATERTTVDWPQAGRPVESTTAFFVPYRPEHVRVEVPCSAVRAGLARGTATTLVSSALPGRPTEGFAVSAADGSVLVLVGGEQVHRGPVPAGDCGLTLDAGADGGVLRLGAETIDLPGAQVREVFAFATDLDPAAAAGTRVTARTADWFQSTPSAGKIVLIGVAVAAMITSLALLVVGDRRGARRSGAGPPGGGSDGGSASDESTADRAATGGGRPARRSLLLIDLALLVVFAAWLVLGPLSPDDSFTEGIVRNALITGDFTNYYRWENSSEAPFTLVLNLISPLVALHAPPLLLRVPSVVAGLLTWLLLSRGVLPVVLPAHARHLGTRVLLAVALLVWWLPFDLGVRPEPFVALGTTAVLTCVLRATAGPGGASVLLLGLGALAGGFTVAVNPVGVTAVAPVLLLAPRILRGLRARGEPPWGWCAVGGCLAAVALVAMFADQSWFGVRQATALHRFYGPDVGWFQEIRRYQYLLGFGDYQGGLARRLPVLLTIAVAGCATLLVVRGARRLPGMRLVPLPLGCLGIGLALLWLTPSKWTHYFGALAGFGAIALTAGVVLLGAGAREWSARREVLLVGGVGTVAAIAAACLAFAGTNTYFLHSHFGVPRDELPMRPLNGPLPWVLLVAVLLGCALLPRFGGRDAARRMLARMPAVVATAAAGAGVLVLLVSFAVAPIARAGGHSVGGQLLGEPSGGGCGIVDDVVINADAPGGVLARAEGDDELTGFTGGGSPAPAGAGPQRWTSLTGGAISTGSLRSGWFAAPRLGPDQRIAVSAAGRTGDGDRLALEFARSTPDGEPRPLGTRVLDDSGDERDARPIYPADRQIEQRPQVHPGWRTLIAEDVPPGADRVRVVAADGTTDRDGWLAVTGPRVLDVVPLRALLAGRPDVYVDWSMTWVAPCLRDVPRVGGGLAQAPTALLNPPVSLGFDGTAAYDRDIGGSFAGVDEVGRRTPIPTEPLGPRDPRYRDWGQVATVTYPIARDAYDTRTTWEIRWGWQGAGFTTGPLSAR